MSDTASKALLQIVKAPLQDLDSFSVRRQLPSAGCRRIGPWVFFDHMGPATLKAGEGFNVRPHPHINLATVTYLFEGEMLHRDSLGSEQLITPGDINLMVAGRGIVHSEREREVSRQHTRRLHGLQLWLALPESDEEAEPAFLHYEASSIPEFTENGVTISLLMGQALGMTSPVKTFADTFYLQASLSAGHHFTLPDGVEQMGVYVVEGEVTINGERLSECSLGVLDSSQTLKVAALNDSRIVVIGGEDIGHRHVWWNFVSTRRERIEQAKADWRAGRFPVVPGDESEYIPLPGSESS